jgi:hypothetical protein
MPALCPIWLNSIHWKPCAIDSGPQVRFISFVDLQGWVPPLAKLNFSVELPFGEGTPGGK